MADLQFNTAEPLQGQPGLTCTACSRPISDTYFEVNGKVVCGPCRNILEDQWNRGGSGGRFVTAFGLGVLAAIGSAIVWYGVMEFTDSQWGILAVLVGLAIGKAVSKGANGRGGWRYQTLAILLTYTAIVSSYAPYVIQGFRERAAQDSTQTTPTDSLVASDSATTATSGAVATQAAPGVGMIVVGLAALLLLLYATPIMIGFQSPITLFILGIALYQAWKLNKKAELRITGPYQVAGRAAPA